MRIGDQQQAVSGVCDTIPAVTINLQFSFFAIALLLGAPARAPFDSTSSTPDGQVLFTDVTAHTGVTFKHHSSPEKKYIVESMSGGVALFDYDNDGWLDLLAVNGHVYPQVENEKLGTAYRQRKLFYKNNRNGTFSEIAAESGPALNNPAVSRGAAFGDVDNDGDIDIGVNNLEGAPTILRNDGGNRNNFVVVRLAGTQGNREGFGARVKVTSGDLAQVDECRSGGSYISQNDTRLHFGLEKRTKVDTIEVRWPKGNIEKVTDIPANRFITIKEGSGVVESKPAK